LGGLLNCAENKKVAKKVLDEVIRIVVCFSGALTFTLKSLGKMTFCRMYFYGYFQFCYGSLQIVVPLFRM